MNTLKPCPFCGSEAEFRDGGPRLYNKSGTRYILSEVRCKKGCVSRVGECFKSGSSGTEVMSRTEQNESAIATWNRRAGEING